MDSLELKNEIRHVNQALELILAKLDLVHKHEEALYGNGKVGLITRIDRIEQRAESHKWILGISIAAFFTSISDWVVKLLKS
jgi:hypothetical protein